VNMVHHRGPVYEFTIANDTMNYFYVFPLICIGLNDEIPWRVCELHREIKANHVQTLVRSIIS
jgi:high-affinity K+ transport system ATPase subunit B